MSSRGREVLNTIKLSPWILNVMAGMAIVNALLPDVGRPNPTDNSLKYLGKDLYSSLIAADVRNKSELTEAVDIVTGVGILGVSLELARRKLGNTKAILFGGAAIVGTTLADVAATETHLVSTHERNTYDPGYSGAIDANITLFGVSKFLESETRGQKAGWLAANVGFDSFVTAGAFALGGKTEYRDLIVHGVAVLLGTALALGKNIFSHRKVRLINNPAVETNIT